MPAKPQTSDGMKTKANRLKGFSRAHTDTDADYNSTAPQQALAPARSNTPAAAHDMRAAPTREEIAKEARIQLPSKTQKQLPAPQANWEFPSKAARNSPAKPKWKPEPETQLEQQTEVFVEDEDATRRAIFDGSQLGDDFMRSGITTPLNEPEDYDGYQEKQQPLQQQVPPVARVPSPELGHEIAPVRKSQPSSRARFQATGAGFEIFNNNNNRSSNQIKTTYGVGARDHRRGKSRVPDGFSNETLQDRQLQWVDPRAPASPAKTTQNLPIREVKIKPQKKESRPKKQQTQELSPYEHFARPSPQARYAGPGEVIDLEDDGQAFTDAAQEETPKQQPRRIRKQPQDTLMESALPPPTMNWNKKQSSRKRRRASLDYDDKVLNEKTFSDLVNEPFDLDPASAGNDQGGDGNPLSNKLERFVHQNEEDQRAFFASMKMDQWEESGDWLVDRFADLMKRTREARREKRKVVADFEEELSQRSEAVRLRSEGLDRQMDKMKENGKRVVGGRLAQETSKTGRREQ